MFRISQYMHELAHPTSIGPKRNPPGPVVIWNLIRRCNLTCKHCYSISADRDFPGELSTSEVFGVMDDLKAFGVPVLILSGGEPLLRPDIFDISHRAKDMGFYVGLSTNGTLIDEKNIDAITAVGYHYVGISIDGMRETHDNFRRKHGAFDASMKGIHLCQDRSIKVGMRFTMTQDNAHELPKLLRLMENEDIDKFYLSHLNYAGRGNINRKHDAELAVTRSAMDLLFDTAWAYASGGRPDAQGCASVARDTTAGTHDSRARIVPDNPLHFHHPWRSDGGGTTAGMQELEQRRERLPGTAFGTAVEEVEQRTRPAGTLEVRTTQEQLSERLPRMSGATKEFVTGNNDADGVYLLFWVKRHFPDRVDHMRAKLAQWGGNSSGVNIANIDNLGNVHPDTFWWHYNLGNVHKRAFSEIWQDVSDPLMAGLKAKPRKVKGRCGQCSYFDVCGGNTRVRAYQLTGDPWAEDPACYLSDDEIGARTSRPRLSMTPYTRQRSANSL